MAELQSSSSLFLLSIWLIYIYIVVSTATEKCDTPEEAKYRNAIIITTTATPSNEDRVQVDTLLLGAALQKRSKEWQFHEWHKVHMEL